MLVGNSMKRLLLLLIPLLAMSAQSQTLKTRWAAGLTPENAHREYPRPQMVRKEWVNLNGLWEYQIIRFPETEVEGKPMKKVLVPFPMESQLSGAMEKIGPRDTIMYFRDFKRPKGDRVLLHFGAVDWHAQVYVNAKSVGEHKGGYDPFTLDITDALNGESIQKLQVNVTDPSDASFQPRGKQVRKPGGIFYTSCSGIWQTVWLEAVPTSHVGSLKIKTWPRAGQVEITTAIEGLDVRSEPSINSTVCRAEILDNGKVVASSEESGRIGFDAIQTTNTMKVADHLDWSPEHPKLYDLRISVLSKGKIVDQVTSYFGFREMSLIKDAKGQPHVALNGKPYFLIGPLDQGFWPDGIYTAPSDAAMKYDLEVTKRLGFNMIRKHVKVEPDRWYYYCDKLGIAVMQDMPSGDKFIAPEDPDIKRSNESAENFKTELKAMIDTHFNHPSIVSWVLYNEGWGQWNTVEMANWLKTYDPSRILNSVTGWSDRGVGDLHDIHVYPGPGSPPNEPNRAIFLGEFGGLGLPVPGHMWKETGWGYQSFKTSKELTDKFVELLFNLRFDQARGLSGAVYTQTTDCETELNGLMTYDRAMIKMDEARVKKAISDLFLPPPTLVQVVPTSEENGIDWRYVQAPPSGSWSNSLYDDSGWKSGPGGFGTPETPGSVVRTRWDTKDIYIRRQFSVNQDYKAGELLLRISYDDDIDVYLDGKPIFKAPGWTTGYRNVPLDAALGKGKHVLAIHCHQNEGGQYVDAGLVQVK